MRGRSVVVFVVGALALVACSSNGGSGPGAGKAPFQVPGPAVSTTKVELPKSYKFVPASITVSRGATVTWTNHDNFPHTVKLLDGSGVLKQLPIGSSATITFNQPGVIYYECSIHPAQMHGKVEVKG